MGELELWQYLQAAKISGSPGLRKGQHAFNLLADFRPDLSKQVRATKLDPFYQDDRLPAFFEFVEENW